MKAVRYEGPRAFSVTDVPDPEPRPGEVVLRSVITGLCGTDLHLHEGEFLAGYPLIPGHEIVGVVEEVDAAASHLQVGQLVAADNTVLCGECYFCARNQPLYCERFHSLGVTGPGGFAEYVRVLASKCFPVDDLTPEQAVFAEPTACAVHGLDVLGLVPGSDVLILGSGPTGLLLAQLLVHGGAARVVVAAPTEFKLERARAYGVDRTIQIPRGDLAEAVPRLQAEAPRGYDVVIDATGAVGVMRWCVELLKTGGTFLVYGVADADARLEVSPYELFARELTLKGSFAQTHCFDRSLGLLRSGRVRTDGMLTHTFTLDEYDRGLETLRSDPSCLKAAVVFPAA